MKNIKNLLLFCDENPNPVLMVEKYRVKYINKSGESILSIKNGDIVPEIFKSDLDHVLKKKITKELKFKGLYYIFDIVTLKEEGTANIYGKEANDIINAQNNLIKANDEWKSLVQNFNQFITIIDKDHKIIFINHPVSGLSLNDIIGMPVYNFIHQDYHKVARDGINHVFKSSENSSYISVATGPDGSLSWYRNELSPIILHNQVESVVFMGEDITDKKKAEQKIFNLAKFPSENPNPILRINQNEVIYINEVGSNKFSLKIGDKIPDFLQNSIKKVFETKKSISVEVAINKAMYSLDFSPIMEEGYVNIYAREISDRKNAEEEIKRLAKFPSENPNPVLRLSRDKVLYTNERGKKIFNIDNGEKIPDILHDSVIKALDRDKISNLEINQNGMLYLFDISPIEEEGYVNIYGRDITDRKKAEDQLIQIMKDLQRSNEELEQFAHTASYDLQDPLRIIIGYIKLLEIRLKDSQDTEIKEFLEYIIDSSHMMMALINGILLYSKVSNINKYNKKIILNDIILEVIENLTLDIGNSNAIITYDNLPITRGKKEVFILLFQSLISNAIKFQKKGNIPKIHIYVKEKSSNWVISIQDNGIGIDPKFYEKIFIIFQRLNDRKKYIGNGIGLSICKKIIEKLGGKIWVESELEKGSVFYFSIPKTV